MIVQSLGMLLTLRCNARCSHCCFECGPRRTETMPANVALRAVRGAARAGLRGVIVTGGEPFLEYDLLRTVVTEAGRLNLGSRVVTNAFWATSADRARALLEPLRTAGLRTLTVSSDDMHERFVPRARVQTAARVGLEMGLRVIVSSAAVSGNPHALAAAIQERLQLGVHPMLWLKGGFVSPNGRAARALAPPSLDPLDALATARRLDAPCPFVVTEPVLTPCGALAACCSPATATRTGFRREFLVGNLAETPFSRLQRRLELDPVFLFLMLRGPFALYRVAAAAGVAPPPDTPIVTQCDLCAALLHDRPAADALRRELEPQRPALVLLALHLLACAGGDLEPYLEARAGVHRSSEVACTAPAPSDAGTVANA